VRNPDVRSEHALAWRIRWVEPEPCNAQVGEWIVPCAGDSVDAVADAVDESIVDRTGEFEVLDPCNRSLGAREVAVLSGGEVAGTYDATGGRGSRT